MHWASKQKGFTIVELLIVVVVIALLAAITIVGYTGITNSAREAALNAGLKQASTAVSADYITGTQTYPAALTGVSSGGDTTYQYTANNNSPVRNFCISVTNSGITKHVAGFSGNVNEAVTGPCPGHTGTQAPLKTDCPAGYITVPGSSLFNTDSFCVMKYEAKNNGSGTPVSTATGTPWVSITQVNAVASSNLSCSGCHLITNDEWLTIAQNVASVNSNWTGGTVGSGSLYQGHTSTSPASNLAASTSDSSGYSGLSVSSGSTRRTHTLTNGEVIWDLSGNVREFTQELITGNQPGTPSPSWQDWETTTNAGGYPSFFPVYANVNAETWITTQNIGRLYSDASSTAIRSVQRGGARSDGNNAGVYTVIINIAEATSNANLGFRVAR